jgi:hypothetical protein
MRLLRYHSDILRRNLFTGVENHFEIPVTVEIRDGLLAATTREALRRADRAYRSGGAEASLYFATRWRLGCWLLGILSKRPPT